MQVEGYFELPELFSAREFRACGLSTSGATLAPVPAPLKQLDVYLAKPRT
jgi:hypothetical protein